MARPASIYNILTSDELMWLKWPKSILLLLLTLSFSLTTSAEFGDEAEVLRVRGSKVLISINGESIAAGDLLLALDDDDKRKGVIRIKKVGKNKAIGKIIKGKAQKGWILERYKRKSKTARKRRNKNLEAPSQDLTEPQEENSGNSKLTLGFLGGYSLGSMSVAIPNTAGSTTAADMTGNSIEYHLFINYRLGRKLHLLATVGQQSLDVAGTIDDNSCTNSNDCTTKINYLTGTALLKYQFSSGNFAPWMAAGLGVMNPTSTESTAVDATSVGTTSVIVASAGTDWLISHKWSIPLQLRYVFFFPSDGVSTSMITGLLGLGYHF